MSRTVLAVGGHIGDMDLTAGPTLAKLIGEGDRAIILACTYGERGHPRLSPGEYRVQKVREGEQFASDIGAEFRVLDYSDGFLPDDDEAANQIADIIRAEKPEIVITHWHKSIHRDHERTAILVERARFLASLPVDSPLGRHGVKQILHADNWEDAEGFEPDLYVPIPEDAFQRWRAAIQNQAFARGETYGFRYIDYYTAMMTAKGCLAGTDRACGFAVGGSSKFELAGP
ncbi:PIG-L deacetylase family protein [Sphaerisporangium fuscum]|uniref:PIG-L deacetylase family protein n=1 Tax=Sphaerisporangium fuscum TaxID=2835868 RepID=UPI001BDD8D4D|nr:PIG-L family deacetylase [Sphaerisporangium fuscum]